MMKRTSADLLVADPSEPPPNPVRRILRRWLLALTLLLAGVALGHSLLADLPAQAAAPAVPTAPPAVILLSSSNSGSVQAMPGNPAKLKFDNEDIIAYNPSTQKYTMFFDGTARGLGKANVEDFEYLPGNELIFTLERPFSIPNPGGSPNPLAVKDSDVVAFDFDTQSFSLYLKGADIGLTTASEDIDALGVAADGDLLISVIGTAKAFGPGNSTVTALDEDILKCNRTGKTCTFYFDGSAIKLTAGSEDVDALWVDLATGHEQNHYLSIKGSFDAQGSRNRLKGAKSDALGCTPLGLGNSTDCFLFKALFVAATAKYKASLDGLWVSFTPLTVAASAVAVDAEESEALLVDTAEYEAALATGDSEVDYYDFFEETLFLPLISQ
jgi:hypothetical protein